MNVVNLNLQTPFHVFNKLHLHKHKHKHTSTIKQLDSHKYYPSSGLPVIFPRSAAKVPQQHGDFRDLSRAMHLHTGIDQYLLNYESLLIFLILMRLSRTKVTHTTDIKTAW